MQTKQYKKLIKKKINTTTIIALKEKRKTFKQMIKEKNCWKIPIFIAKICKRAVIIHKIGGTYYI